MTKVVLDAVGGDHAPKECIAGVALALKKGFVQPSEAPGLGMRWDERAVKRFAADV